MNRKSLLLIALVAGGCATDVDALPSALERPLPEEAWIHAPASCDSVQGAVRVHATEVRELAVLLDANGDVLCVDVVDLIAEQHRELFQEFLIQPISGWAAVSDPPTSDPTPDPMRPSDPPTSDPTPDPMRPSDPPTSDPTPDPMRRSDSPTSDPTPDPMRPTSYTYSSPDDPTPDPMRPTRYGTSSDPTPDPMRPAPLTDRSR